MSYAGFVKNPDDRMSTVRLIAPRNDDTSPSISPNPFPSVFRGFERARS